MRCTLSSVGVPLGSVVLAPGERTIAPLDPLRAFETSDTRASARAVGIALRVLAWSRRLSPHVRSRVLASAIARAHEQQSALTLADERGAQIPVARILVIEFPRDRVPIVIVNLRDEPAGCVVRGTVPPRHTGARRR